MAGVHDPVFYTEPAVADTLDGRFDTDCLHVALLTRQPAHRKVLAQARFDAMLTDMGGCLRKAGVGDLGCHAVRDHAHDQGPDHDGVAALSAGLPRDIWRGRQDAALATRPEPELAESAAGFLPAASTGLTHAAEQK